MLILVALSLYGLHDYRSNHKENTIPFLGEKKKVVSPILKKKKEEVGLISRVYSQMRRDFALLRQQAFFVSDHTNT